MIRQGKETITLVTSTILTSRVYIKLAEQDTQYIIICMKTTNLLRTNLKVSIQLSSDFLLYLILLVEVTDSSN